MRHLLMVLVFFCSQPFFAQHVYELKDTDVKPVFKGGADAFHQLANKYFSANVENYYANTYGSDFTVEKDGSVTRLKMLGNTAVIPENKIADFLQTVPKWTPARVKGKTVRCHITFIIENVQIVDVSALDREDLTIAIDTVQDAEPKPENFIYAHYVLDKKPEFPGHIEHFYTFFKKNFVVPDVENLNGKAYITFVIEKDGTVTDVKVLRDLGFGTRKEILRVMKLCPKWIPGEVGGKAVRVQYNLPIPIKSDEKK